jgi:hypothetical protein
MNGLYPIIRRVRRPLVPVEGAAGGADAKPAPVLGAAKPEPVGGDPKEREESNGEGASSERGE